MSDFRIDNASRHRTVLISGPFSFRIRLESTVVEPEKVVFVGVWSGFQGISGRLKADFQWMVGTEAVGESDEHIAD